MFGVLGSMESYYWNSKFEVLETNLTNISTNFLYHGIDWIYCNVQSVSAYDFKIWYFWFFNSIYDESFDFFFFLIDI